MQLDEVNIIGVIDLRTCLQAIAQCSPEIVNQQDSDYTVYAYDYSEPDLPLVGQGMLSWGLDQSDHQHQHQQQQQQLVTGRVTRNMLAILSNGSRETLEVKMKLTAVAKMHRAGFPAMDGAHLVKPAPTHPDMATSSEWNSFLQSNPMLGHSATVTAIPSPVPPPAQPHHPPPLEMRYPEPRHEYQPIRPASRPASRPTSRPSSIPPPITAAPPAAISSASFPPPLLTTYRPVAPAEGAPSPLSSQPVEIAPERPARPSRPSSRASRSRVPTGRPRGRPRKKPVETGHTSAAEEATDGDDGPQKKRAKTTKAEYSTIAPFVSAPDSLRVAASTSGSLRTMRPVGSGSDAPTSNSLQDMPRAPTPIPAGPPNRRQQKRIMLDNYKPELAGEVERGNPYQSRLSQPPMQRSMSTGVDACSPAESIGQSPDQGYTPEDSTADLGSSPPVPRTSAYMRSSPIASSPILPTMPIPQADSGFMSGGMDDYFDDEILQELPQPRLPDTDVNCQLPAAKPDSRKRSWASHLQQEPQPPPQGQPQPHQPHPHQQHQYQHQQQQQQPHEHQHHHQHQQGHQQGHQNQQQHEQHHHQHQYEHQNQQHEHQHQHQPTQQQAQPQAQPQPDAHFTSQLDPSTQLHHPASQHSQPSTFPFQEVNPGPPELLPVSSIFNPQGKVKTLNRAPAPAQVPAPAPPPPTKKTANRSLKRCNTAPATAPTGEVCFGEQPLNQPSPLGHIHDDAMQQSPANLSLESSSFADLSHSVLAPEQALESPRDDAIEPSQPEPARPGSAVSAPTPETFAPPELPSAEPTLSLPALSPAEAGLTLPQLPAADGPLTLPTQMTSRPGSRPGSSGLTVPTVPASDPVTESVLTLPRAFMSETAGPPSDALEPPRYNKNQVKKQSIKERLENAIQKGEMPPFCNNCGAIETPTWRKIWTQNHNGVPPFHELSDKPGRVTVIDILERDSEGLPTVYQLVKKNLGPNDDKTQWKESLLCNRKCARR